MRGRLGMLIGFGAGYVLGSKAGRERYEQLRRLYENVQLSPAFQKATGRAKDAVGSGLGQAKDLVLGGVSKVSDAVKERKTSNDHPSGGLSVAPPPNN